LTVTFGKSGTTVYRDGLLVRRSSIRLSPGEISGRIVIGNSPIFNDSWGGVIYGLAIYDAALTETQVARHYASWIKGSVPADVEGDACIALYRFDEHSGSVFHNRVRPVNDLYAPPRYLVLRQTVLDPVWRAFKWSRGFWKDAFINIAGFMPFGCFVCAYLLAVESDRPILIASATGGAVSLFIELVQTQLPTRDSSMSDLINNIVGTFLGALSLRGIVVRAIRRNMSMTIGIVERIRAFRRGNVVDLAKRRA
jgi:hypothetical protein